MESRSGDVFKKGSWFPMKWMDLESQFQASVSLSANEDAI